MPESVALLVGLLAVVLYEVCRRTDARIERRTQPPREIDMERLEEIAAVSDEEIIAAAEWWVEHPDADEPSILRDLDPSAWAIQPEPWPPLRSASLDPPPPPKPSKGGPTTARSVAIVPDGVYVERRKGRYDDCTHRDAERVQIMSHASSMPVKSVVTECARCDRHATAQRLQRYLDQMKQILDDTKADGFVMPADLAKHYQRLQDEAARCAIELDRLDQQLKDAEPVTWPGRMF